MNRNDFKIEVISSSKNEMIFDMIGIDAPLANAFRRIMLSEVIYHIECCYRYPITDM
jgi:DNA-directed RNA polymerase alpha subunit